MSFVVIGMGSFAVATMSGLAAYDDTLISVHMVQHMVLSMLVPLALALGAPVTLALRTLPATPRRWLLALLHSRVAAVLSFAPLTFLLYVVSPWALYFTGWYDASLASDWVHEVMHVHLVAVGALFFWPLMGIDPVPGRVGLPVPGAAGRADAALPRLPRRDDHGGARAARRQPLPGAARPARSAAGCPTRSPTSTWPAGSSGARAT